ncbi:MAG TPA: phage holin family protein, partial [Thermoanaerobaculia bacterium]|nr:phage holin family protein [Thermoanaerobaculia bacterium]
FCSDKRVMARNAEQTDSERSLGTIVKELTEDITTLFRSEIALLKLEVKDTVAKLGGGIGLFAGALFVGLFGLAFLFVTILLVLVRLGVPAWLSALIVTVVLLVTAGILAMMGKKKFAAVEFVPAKSIESIKTDIDSIKTDIAQARSK